MEILKICFRDEMGYAMVDVDQYGIDFLNGAAYFSDGCRDYKIKAENIIRICVQLCAEK